MKLKGGEYMQKVIMWLSIIAVIALAVLNLTYRDGIEPDSVHPFANQHITWNTKMPLAGTSGGNSKD